MTYQGLNIVVRLLLNNSVNVRAMLIFHRPTSWASSSAFSADVSITMIRVGMGRHSRAVSMRRRRVCANGSSLRAPERPARCQDFDGGFSRMDGMCSFSLHAVCVFPVRG